jgi:hypothetical protein
MKQVGATVLVTAAAALALFLLLDGTALAAGFEVLIVALALFTLRGLLSETGDEGPLGLGLARRRKGTPTVLPASLRRVERLIAYGPKSNWSAERRLLPMLRGLAAERLAANHGIDPTTDPATARSLLGEAAWRRLQPRADPHSPGPHLDELVLVVEAIERL